MNIEKLKELAEQGLYYSQIAEQLNCSESTVKKYARKNNIKIATKIIRANNEETKEQIQNLLNQGKTNLEIAKELHISPTTARRYTKELLGRDTNTIRAKKIENVSLSQEQLEIIYGCLLGDMCITTTQAGARLYIGQGGQHENYFDHLCEIFKDFLGKISKAQRFDKRTNKYYSKYSVRSLANIVWKNIYDEIYINGVKTITQNWLDKITWRSIAYWFMDDGSVRGLFATNCFSLEEVKLLQKMFSDKFNIQTRIRQMANKTNQWLLIIENKDLENFEKQIKPYILDSMSYKLVKVK